MIRAAPHRFARALAALDARPVADPVAHELLGRWAEPHRHYHTLDHLEFCLAELDAHRALADSPDIVEVALWFHDAIYVPRAADNEARSASLAANMLRSVGVAPAFIRKVEDLILATRAHAAADDPDTDLLLDIDLSVLGAAPEDYQAYAAAIRREYAWVPETDYRAKRSAVLARFLERSRIYRHAPFFDRLEKSARANLASEIVRLAARP